MVTLIHSKAFLLTASAATAGVAIATTLIHGAASITTAHLQQPPPQQDLASTYRQLHRARFDTDLAAGVRKPLLIPLYLCGVYFVPALYLAIPHRGDSRGRWAVYAARWPLLAALVWFHTQMILRVSSPNFASAYAAGLLAAWGIIWNFTVLVWTRPQWDAKRVERRVGRRKSSVSIGRKGESQQGGSRSTGISDPTSDEFTARPRLGNGHANGHTNGHATSSESSHRGGDGSKQDRGLQNGNGHLTDGNTKPAALREAASTPGPEDDVEYFWQDFPEDARFLTRLNWAFDYVAQFRMVGWNCAIPSLPPYEPPAYNQDSKQQPLESLPDCSRDGYTRVTDRKTYIYQTLLYQMLPAYILIDLLAVLVTADPHFIVGPEHGPPLPPGLAALHPFTRFMYRQILSLLAILSALQLILNLGQLLICLVCKPIFGSFRTSPWHLPTITGSFTQVLDRGLTGFWGSWWHQTFRFGFAAPTKWLLRKGYITKGTLAADAASFVIAFVQSGFLHAAGSYTTAPTTRWWMPPATFLLSGLGMLLQQNLSRLLWRSSGIAERETTPRWVRRAGNLAFVLVWLSLTAWPLLDDFARSGLWLFEPVPVSLFRAFTGFGDPADRRVWRWDRDFFPQWYSGPSWIWDTGVGV
ncbi:hypothetical protein Micbo1qcDRAFT_157503 [Microdochium bolleyi]|uniref:Wax synthase domain-containing protein n=1 Tax=Microdochium bolleyi TaxID=196109 RepID=A0A136JEH0_9PEZI|nr:hypothetical protein Micbo1qcDRAFT_157503 [Microdochium bolleyi]